jgi:Flp pilus assembly protein TadD
MSGSENAIRNQDMPDFFRYYWLKRSTCWIVGVLVVAGISVTGFRTYRVWQKHHLAWQARAFFDKHDYGSAVLVARHLLQIDLRNCVACRIIAQTAQLAGRSEAISWFEKLSEVEPSIENQFALASAALRFGQLDLCNNVLEKMPPNASETSQFHQLTAAVCLAKKQSVLAANHFEAALRLEPNNDQIALNLAITELASPASGIVQKARRELLRLSNKPSTRLEALRALTTDATANKQHPEAEQYGARLKAEKNASFADRMLWLAASQDTGQAAAALAEIKAAASARAATASELITWMNRHNLAKEALTWAKQLPTNIATAQPVPLAIAESYSFAQDWKSLRDFVDGKNWDHYEDFRLAVASHAARRMKTGSMESEVLWSAALKKARTEPGHLAAIAQLAEGWGYTDQSEEAWWAMANTTDNPKAALLALNRRYENERNTLSLLRVARRACELNPNDVVAANNYASLSLLIKGDPSAYRLAEKLHLKYPRNTAFAVTYAFALHSEGKTADGLKIFGRLREDQLRVPVVAAYYVIMLTENGDIERAREFLTTAKKARLLPEENRLLADAARKLTEGDGDLVSGGHAHS